MIAVVPPSAGSVTCRPRALTMPRVTDPVQPERRSQRHHRLADDHIVRRHGNHRKLHGQVDLDHGQIERSHPPHHGGRGGLAAAEQHAERPAVHSGGDHMVIGQDVSVARAGSPRCHCWNRTARLTWMVTTEGSTWSARADRIAVGVDHGRRLRGAPVHDQPAENPRHAQRSRRPTCEKYRRAGPPSVPTGPRLGGLDRPDRLDPTRSIAVRLGRRHLSLMSVLTSS